MTGETLEELAARAVGGDTDAVDRLVRTTKDDVYNLAIRMLGDPFDAEDATQEILVKVVTRLSSFRGESGLRTWIWRVASNHLLSVRRGRGEPEALSFESLEGMLAAGLASPSAAAAVVDPEQHVLEEEVKIGCTSSMLACLDRDHRLAFILGDVFDLTGDEGAEVLEIEPAAFRKRLSRARQRMRAFMETNCGLVSDAAPCRCSSQIGPSIHMGLLDPARLRFATHPARDRGSDFATRQQYEAIERARGSQDVHPSTEVFRSHPNYVAPERLVDRLRAMVGASPD